MPGNALRGAGAEDSRILVPEHEVKRLLAELGVRVPRGTAIPYADGPDAVAKAAEQLGATLVLKAYGPGLVHKTDVGAVRLGLDSASVAAEARTMAVRLAGHGVVPDGWLVEDQQAAGVEVIVGRVRGPFGDAMLLGLGGTLAETLDQAVVRLARSGAVPAGWFPGGSLGAEMIAAMPGLDALRAARGAEPVDLDALALLVDALDGLPAAVAAAYPGFEPDEFECNPVIATAEGAVAVDARLILRRRSEEVGARDVFAGFGDSVKPGESGKSGEDGKSCEAGEAGEHHASGDGSLRPESDAPGRTDFAPLFAPRTVAVAGASTGKTTFGNRFLAAYRAFGWTDGLYAVHPSAESIDGVPAVASVADIPGGADYLLVAVPAAATPALVAAAAGHARFVHVVSGGFREAGAADLEDELLVAARRAGVRLLGPNCLGVYAPSGRQTFQLGVSAEPGGVGVVSQSGGLAGDIVAAGTRRGLRFSGLVTIGNAIDVGAAELVEHFVDDPATEVIGMYLEGTRGGERLARAVLRAGAHRKPVVVLAGGLSRQGARAVASHTGALAGEERMWQALSAASGLSVVHTLEDFLAVLAMLQRYPRAEAWSASERRSDSGSEAGSGSGSRSRTGVLVIGPGGGASVLATDACDRAGLAVRPLPADVVAALRERGYGAGTSLLNPIEIPLGPATGPDSFARVLDPVLAATEFADVLLHVNVQSYYGYADTGVAPLLALVESLAGPTRHGVRLSLVPRNLDCAPSADAEGVLAACARSGVPAFRDLDQAAVAIAAAQRLREPRA
ncbi:acetate--CoA ligase family protein [Streptodolium elevatio]|uniref:Acetate--CoA ligase family protein n=1 Tax=Streptodolium elevatio TaxID=3157996 RepID=A0ABV3D9N7_9ACTN